MSISNKPILVAHRGNSFHAPENTLAAFRSAVDLKIPFIECDIHLTKDGVPVVIHDLHLARTSDHPENETIDAMTLEQIKKLDCGRWFHESFSGEKILTLRELLDAPLENVGVMIEVKGGSAPDERLVAAVLKDVSDHREKNPQRQIIVGSKSTNIVRLVKSFLPEIRTVGIVEHEDEFIPHLEQHPNVIAAHKAVLTEDWVRRFHDEGKDVWVWTVDHPEEVSYCLKCRVDGIISNDPKYVETQILER